MKVEYHLDFHLKGKNGDEDKTVSYSKDSALPDMTITEGQIISLGFRNMPKGYQPTIEFTVAHCLLFDPVDREPFYSITFEPRIISDELLANSLGYDFLETIEKDRSWE